MCIFESCINTYREFCPGYFAPWHLHWVCFPENTVIKRDEKSFALFLYPCCIRKQWNVFHHIEIFHCQLTFYEGIAWKIRTFKIQNGNDMI